MLFAIQQKPGGKEMETFNCWVWNFIWSSESVLEMDDGGGCTTVWMFLILLSYNYVHSYVPIYHKKL